MFPALDILKNLREVDVQLFEEGRAFLFSKAFRFVITGDIWPHMYVLRAFRKEVLHEWSKHITRVLLAKFTRRGLFELARSRKGQLSFSKKYNKTLLTSVYDKADIARDLRYVMWLLGPTFPHLETLDLNIDPIEIVPGARHLNEEDRLATLEQKVARMKNPDWEDSTHAQALKELANLGKTSHVLGVESLHLRIFWGDFIQKAFFRNNHIDPEFLETIQSGFVTRFRAILPAKSITSHTM